MLPWRVKIPTQSLLILLMLLMLMMRIVLATLQIWELRIVHKAKLLFRLCAQGLVKILKLKFGQDLKQEFGQYFVADVLERL